VSANRGQRTEYRSPANKTEAAAMINKLSIIIIHRPGNAEEQTGHRPLQVSGVPLSLEKLWRGKQSSGVREIRVAGNKMNFVLHENKMSNGF
jgi:hypothetical protein